MFHLFLNLAFKVKKFTMCPNLQVFKNFSVANPLLESVFFDRNRSTNEKIFPKYPQKSIFFFQKKNNNNKWGVAHGFGHPMDHLGVTSHAPPFGLGGGHLEVGWLEPSLWYMGWPKQSTTIFIFIFYFFFKKKKLIF